MYKKYDIMCIVSYDIIGYLCVNIQKIKKQRKSTPYGMQYILEAI